MKRWLIIAPLLCLLACTFGTAGTAISAEGLYKPGTAAVSGFSGVRLPEKDAVIPAGKTADDLTFIDPQGPSIRILDGATLPAGRAANQALALRSIRDVPASAVGQVFGLAFDREPAPSLYAAASSAFGLRIVGPDTDGDGRPERLRRGSPGARWMDGQWGPDGGPGSIWRIDGETGTARLFTTLPNSGAGIGAITYDGTHRQIFASDLDTGVIHRIDPSGKILDSYDHGLSAFSSPVSDDAVTADITSPDFDTEDSATWGLTQPERRVWGLAYHGSRLYYAVWGGFEVWSVGIAETGEFAGDPRLEVTIPATPKAYPVSDLAFDAAGNLLVAQRADLRSRYDYSAFTLGGQVRTLRFLTETPDDPDTPSLWNAVPQDYAVGLGSSFQNGAGGLALGPGYNDDGTLALDRCDATLWVTSNALTASEGAGGVQLSASDAVREGDAPPSSATYVLYGGPEAPPPLGAVGDVAVLTACTEQVATGPTSVEPDTGETPDGDTDADADAGTPPVPPPTEGGHAAEAPDLSVTTLASYGLCKLGAPCEFRVIIANEGAAPYIGPIQFRNTLSAAVSISGAGPSPWSCTGDTQGQAFCRHPAITLAPGQSKQLTLLLTLGKGASGLVRGCAALDWNPQSLMARNWAVQNALADIGYDPGTIDGNIGPLTTAAIMEFRAATGLPASGAIDLDLLDALFDQWGVGDEVAANDQACDTVRIADAPPPPPVCAAPKVLIAGICTELPNLCFGGRAWDPDRAQCACPASRPFWDAVARQCEVFLPSQSCSNERFWNGMKCVCPASRPFWNKRQQACVAFISPQVCKGGRLWDGRMSQCICPTHKPHWNAARKECQEVKACRGDQVWDPVGKFCTCPPARPFWARDIQRCIRIDATPTPVCRGNQEYSAAKDKCVCPPEKPFWVPALKSCVTLGPGPLQCDGGMVFDYNRKDCVCPRGSRFDNGQKRCVRPDQPPQCTGGMVLDNARKSCVCPRGSDFDPAQKKCVRPGPQPPQCTGGRVLDKDGKSCVCRSGLTFDATQKRCVRPQPPPPPPPPTCNGGQYYDRSSGDCVCPRGTQFDPSQQRCERPQPQPNCRGGRVRQGSQCVCPPGRRELNGVCVRVQVTDPGPRCGRGQMLIGGVCTCPGGQVYSRIRKRCSRIPTRIEPDQMAPGFTLPCPAGTEFRRGRCRFPRGQGNVSPLPLIP
ncbi:hypothetical protein BH10PSE7_BH10PSE7_37360 [soil metagenome]